MSRAGAAGQRQQQGSGSRKGKAAAAAEKQQEQQQQDQQQGSSSSAGVGPRAGCLAREGRRHFPLERLSRGWAGSFWLWGSSKSAELALSTSDHRPPAAPLAQYF